MATATRKQKAAAESVKMSVAMKRLGLSDRVIIQMIALGYFTEHRNSPLSPISHYRIYTDEIDHYLELPKKLDRNRLLAAMLQYRDEMGRK